MGEFQGRTAVVTGGNRGIGLAIAAALVREGAQVLLVGRRQAENDKAVQELSEIRAGAARAFRIDVADKSAVRRLAAEAAEVYAKVDILVNNAGICHMTTAFADLPDTAWQQTLAVNLYGMIHCTRAFLPLIRQAGGGKIIMTASLAAEVGGIATAADYVASKAAVLGLTKSLARELGPEDITVNAIAPGFVRTKMTEKMQISLDSIPLRRMAEPEDIANAAVFLASSKARCITGTTLDVNGGLFLK